MKAAPEKETMTRNQALVLNALHAASGPLSAYDILDRLRAEGLRSPLQVYRALSPLVERGRVHRLESLNSFVACAHRHDEGYDEGHGDAHPHRAAAFAICEKCGQVDEFADEAVAGRLNLWADGRGFRVAKTTVELRGTCAQCLAA